MSGEGPAAVRGWGCTPTEESPTAASEHTARRCLPIVITRGWRRTLLYGILAILMLLIFLNIALTLWIIATLRLSVKGIGPLMIISGGMQLHGHALVTERLITSSLVAPSGHPLVLHSHRNFTILVSQPDYREHSKLFIKRNSVEFGGRVFEVSDARGASLFRASRDEVRVAASALTLDGDGGVNARAALQTPLVRAPPGSDLELESQTRKLELRAPQSIHLESRAGEIDITSHKAIKLDSVAGAINLDASDIYLRNLRQGRPTDANTRKNKMCIRVYQMCACASGKLFLAYPDSTCSVPFEDKDVCFD